MDAETRAAAESRLTDAATAAGLADPRPPLRERLRLLRERQPDDFSRAVSHYEAEVLPRLAVEEPLPVWLDYARFLGQVTSNGRLTVIDDTGRAANYRAPLPPASLVLFLPEDMAVAPLVAAAPTEPSPAQQATLALLVERRLAL